MFSNLRPGAYSPGKLLNFVLLKGKIIRASSCDIRQKVDKSQKKFLHRQYTGKNIQATQESPIPPITSRIARNALIYLNQAHMSKFSASEEGILRL